MDALSLPLSIQASLKFKLHDWCHQIYSPLVIWLHSIPTFSQCKNAITCLPVNGSYLDSVNGR